MTVRPDTTTAAEGSVGMEKPSSASECTNPPTSEQETGGLCEPVVWIVDWRNKPSEGCKSSGGGSCLIRNQYAAVVDKVAMLNGLSWVETVTVTPLVPEAEASTTIRAQAAELERLRALVALADKVKPALDRYSRSSGVVMPLWNKFRETLDDYEAARALSNKGRSA